jgi:ribosomal protein S18 acetylase RimI-like enzyme
MELVEAGVADLDALVERWYALGAEMEAYDELNELVYADAEAVPEDGFRAHLDDDEVTEYLIVDDGETIGFLTLRESEHPSREYARSLRIVNLAIDEGHRNRGHGTAVVERVEEWGRERGCDRLEVPCEWENDGARRFYREAGFRPKQVVYARPLD